MGFPGFSVRSSWESFRVEGPVRAPTLTHSLREFSSATVGAVENHTRRSVSVIGL